MNGDCNLSSGSVYRINGTPISNTVYTGGTNITIAANNAINLDSSITLTGTSTFTGKLVNTGGSRIVIQNGVDGGNTNGIAMWLNTDSNWAIYMASSGANKSFAGATAVAGYDFSLHSIRFRTYNNTNQGFIFEQLCMYINSGSKDVYMANNLKVAATIDGAALNFVS